MHRKLPAILALAFVCAYPLRAQHGVGGHSVGGHGGFGGGHSVGHVGHSVGSSFSHFFGRRSGGRGNVSAVAKPASEAPPLAGAAMIRGKVTQLPNPQSPLMIGRPRFHRAPLREFAFPRHFGSFVFGFNSFSDFCDPARRFFGRPMLFEGDSGCFGGSFFFDPFFLAGFDPFALESWNSGIPVTAVDLSSAANEAQLGSQQAGAENLPQTDHEPMSQDQRAAPPETLLQLTSGSMYALTSYWLEGDRLYYVTSYGGENSVPLDQIDFNKTIRLNAVQGIKFEIHPKPRADNL